MIGELVYNEIITIRVIDVGIEEVDKKHGEKKEILSFIN